MNHFLLNSQSSYSRINWVDVAKGIAILWVVALHIGLLGEPGSVYEDILFRSWTMPLFWIVSGLFLSHQDSFKTFLGKRINNLIVPLCFFVFLTNCLFWVCSDLLGGTEVGWIQRKFHWVSTIQFCWYEGHDDFRNFPLWFLPALLWTSLFYKTIIILSKDRLLFKSILVTLAVFVVMALSYYSINLHFFLDEGLYALPFFLVADIVHDKKLVLFEVNKSKCFLVGGGSLILFFLFYELGSLSEHYYVIYQLLRYLLAFSGVLFISSIANLLSFSKFLGFCGRNSLIILGVHLPLTGVRPFMQHFIPEGPILNVLLFVITVLGFCIIVLLFNRFIPKLVGKDKLLNV